MPSFLADYVMHILFQIINSIPKPFLVYALARSCSWKRRILSHRFFFLTGNVKGLVTRGKLAWDKADKALSLLKGSLDYSDFKDVDMVIEVGSCVVSF